MLGIRLPGRRGRDEAEKPFWISYADLMTALMMLFMIVMAVSLLVVTKRIDTEDQRKRDRDLAIENIMDRVRQAASKHAGVSVDDFRIRFGELLRFRHDDFRIVPAGARQLRAFVPEILEVAESDIGQRWLKRVVIEGFTDRDGDYLYNAKLSLNRGYSVLCVFFERSRNDDQLLTARQLALIRDLFMVGGFSFNEARDTKEASRRVELRLEFWGLDEAVQRSAAPVDTQYGVCRL